jgi:hypothetical protein
MSIPDFDGILNVLPPHLGDPRQPADLSPYVCTVEELCQRFSFSSARRGILNGFLNLRKKLRDLGIQGFQWLDGSFVEDIETQEDRPPDDIDVVTFAAEPHTSAAVGQIIRFNPDLWDPPASKATYHVDHYLVSLCSRPETIVDNARYWYGLFSHRRDCTWKGMLRIEIASQADDDSARRLMENKS